MSLIPENIMVVPEEKLVTALRTVAGIVNVNQPNNAKTITQGAETLAVLLRDKAEADLLLARVQSFFKEREISQKPGHETSLTDSVTDLLCFYGMFLEGTEEWISNCKTKDTAIKRTLEYLRSANDPESAERIERLLDEALKA